MAATGQTINDRINAARYALAGQGLARCVCKATTEEVIGPKKKHLDYLLACTQEPNVSIPQLANLLIERTNHISWVVVFKALVTVHHLMCYGNERFTQYLASSNYSFQLSSFLDKTAATNSNMMSTFIRRYSKYINEKALSYRTLAFDLCKITRGNQGLMRTMPADRLLKTIPILQNQLDALLEFDCSANDLNNGVINACFMLLFRDLIRLFACHNDGIINLLERYFTLNRKLCRDAFEIYKKFLVRMDKVSDFLRVAEAVGIDKDDIPDLKRAPSSLLDALQQHLESIESNKKYKTTTTATKTDGAATGLPLPSTIRPSTPNSSSFSVSDEFSISGIKDEEVKKALEEEARVLSQYGMKSSKNKSPRSTTNELISSSSGATEPKTIDDIFGKSNDSFSSNTTNNNNIIDSKPKKSEDPIKLSLASATAALKNSNGHSKAPQTAAPKASDDLFSLLDAPTSNNNLTQSSTIIKSSQDISNFSKQTSKVELANNPFASFSNSFGSDSDSATNPHEQTKQNVFPTTFQPNLLSMGNDFNNLSQPQTAVPSQMPFGTPSLNQVKPPTSSDINFEAAFGSNNGNLNNSTGFDVLGDLLQPVPLNKTGANQTNLTSAFSGATKPSLNNSMGGSSLGGAGISGGNNLHISSAGSGLFKGDLDATLANLAQNLTFDAGPKSTFKK